MEINFPPTSNLATDSKYKGTIFQLADGSIQGCNQDVEKILGYSIEQLQNRAYFALPWRTIDKTAADFDPDNHPAIATLRTGKPHLDVVMGLYKSDGDLVWLLLDSQPLFQVGSDKPYGVVTTIEEIAEKQETVECQVSLKESKERLKLATEASGTGMWFGDLEQNTLELTEQSKALFGLPVDQEFTYEMFFARVHPEDRDEVDAAIKAALASNTGYNAEYRVIWPDGTVHWIAAQGKGLYNQEGTPVRMIGTVQDISDRKQTEAELLKTNSILESIISDTSSIIFVKDLEGRYVIANPAAANFLGTDIEKMIGRDDLDLFPPQIARSIMALDQQIITEGIARSYEEDIDNGTEKRSLITNKYPWRDGSGNTLGVIGLCRDITALKQSQQQLEKNEKLLRLALSSANAGLWDWEIKTDKVVWSPENYDLYELDPQQGSPQYQDWANKLHREDREKINHKVQQIVLGQIPLFREEFRIIHSQGEVRWLLGMGNVTLDSQGNPTRLSGINLDITERKQTEQALQKSKQQLQKILDSLPVYVGLLNPDGTVVFINQTALDGAGLQLEDVVGQPFAQTYWWSISTALQAKIDDAVKQAAAGKIVRFDTIGRGGGEGKQILVDFSIIPIFNEAGQVEYLIPSGIDIGDREASKQALKQRERELKLITEVIPQQVWTALPNGELDYINRRWQEYAGCSQEEMQSQGWTTIVHPDDLSQVKRSWDKAIKSGQNYNIKARLGGKDGVYRWFLGRARPLRNDQGKIVKWYGTNTSINRIKELEDQLRQQTEDLINANRLKDEFLAIVSHELRTPLNPILGWAQLLASGRLDLDKTTQGIEIIERNAKLQTELIDDLLDVSRILRGKLNLKQTPLNLESIIRSALTTVELAANAKEIQIETRLEANIGQVFGDAARIQQIVWNLVSNAIKFTPKDGRVTVQLERVGDQAQIQVTDTGKGIEPEFLPYVFERFRQAESSSTREFGGLGLGLAIVRHLTELHGGTVAVNSLGSSQGATFSVKLPLMNTPQMSQAEHIFDNQAVATDRFSNLRVLVVDDEPDSLDILTMVLEQKGAQVTPVTSAKLALAALQKSTPDLIISDIGMPQVDGYTLMTQIRELPQGENIPAIALTAYAGEIDQQRSFDVGFQYHLAKPINIPGLINAITQLLW